MDKVLDAFRNWLMHIIAGKTKAFWVSDKATMQLDGLGVAGKGAAIVLVSHVKAMNATEAIYTLAGGWTVTVQKTNAEDTETDAS